MKRILCLTPVLILMIFAARSDAFAQDLPMSDSSRAVIQDITPKLARLDSALNDAFRTVERGQDIIVTVKMRVINTLFTAIASGGWDDCVVKLLPTKNIWSDTKSLFGVSVTSSIDIDSGTIVVDLKQFTVPSMKQNIIESHIELEGSGLIAVKGQSAGVPGRAMPRLGLYMQDRIRFACFGDKTGMIMLRPEPSTVVLKAKLSVKLWGFDVPYYKEIPLAVADILPVFKMPVALTSSVRAPLRGTYGHERGIEYADYSVSFSALRVWANNDELELRTNITIH